MKKETNKQLTDEDKAKYDEYLRRLDNLSYLIPETPIPAEVWDKIEATGKIPEDYSDRIGMIEIIVIIIRLHYRVINDRSRDCDPAVQIGILCLDVGELDLNSLIFLIDCNRLELFKFLARKVL